MQKSIWFNCFSQILKNHVKLIFSSSNKMQNHFQLKCNMAQAIEWIKMPSQTCENNQAGF